MNTYYSIRNAAVKTVSVGRGNVISLPINEHFYQEELTESPNLFQNPKNNVHLNLNLDNIRKMIQRFLSEKRMPLKKLAKVLGVTTEELAQYSSKKGLLRLAYKVNLPLVKLYCKTKWERAKSAKS